MKEVVFIKRNIKKWQNFENALENSNKVEADDLAEIFIELTDDLAFAKTYYPKSDITKYINSIAVKFHHVIYSNKKEKKGVLKQFWKVDFPCIFYENRKKFYYSLIIFFIATFIGIISAAEDNGFIRIIMGDDYVNNTIENIRNNDPMAVYKKSNELPMFLGITINNIKVSFYAFIAGILLSIGTGWILFSNGIMLGSFHYFMYQQGVLKEALLTIWMHGTLEIFAIIVAGAAGLMLGNSILFPKTFSRRASFRKATKNSVKIIIGLIPCFIIAGFIEGFITRHTEIPDIFRLIFISISFISIIWYFFLYPSKIISKSKKS